MNQKESWFNALTTCWNLSPLLIGKNLFAMNVFVKPWDLNIIKMKINSTAKTLFLALGIFCCQERSIGQQLDIRDFTLLSGPNGTGTTLIGSSITLNGGAVGSYKLVQTTGNVAFNGANIYSADKIILTNSNIVNARIAAAANFPN